MTPFTQSLGVAALVAVLVAGSAQAQDAAVDLVQPGDSEKACAVLASEINTLSEREAKATRRAESNRKFLGFAGAALQAAAPLLSSGKLGGQSGYLAQQALGSIQAQTLQQAQQQQMAQAYGAMSGLAPGMADTAGAQADRSASVEAQRVAHLRDIYAQKSC